MANDGVRGGRRVPSYGTGHAMGPESAEGDRGGGIVETKKAPADQ